MSVAEMYEDPPRTAPRRQAVSARIPPHNLSAEESLLGAMLLSKDAIAAATEVGIAGDDFYKPAHGHIYDAICGLYSIGEPVDPVTVAESLSRRDLLDAIGGPAILVTLQAATPATTSAARYARIVEEHALLRRLIGVAGEIAESAYDLPDDVVSAIDRAESLVFQVAQRRVTDSMSVIGSLLDDNLNRLEALYERGEAITGIPTGYQDLDELLAGFQPSNLVVVGARPAMGKCLAAGTRLVDPRTGALRTVEDLVAAGAAGDDVEVLALWEEPCVLTARRPSAFVDDGVKPTWTVRTRLGRQVTTTATHPFRTRTGWEPLADLRVGTPIAVPARIDVFGHDDLPDGEVALLGYLVADGGTTGLTTLFVHPSDVVRQETAEAAGRIGVRDALRRHGVLGLGAAAARVPDAVFRLPERQVARFLARLFAIGGAAWWTDTGDGRVSYRTVSRRLAADVQHLLLRFGIAAVLCEREISLHGARQPGFEVEIRAEADLARFATAIGIVGQQQAVEALVEWAVRHRAPVRTPRLAAVGGGAGRSHDDAAPDVTGDVIWDEIAAIEPAGDQRVFDLTVPELHNFVADDVCVHNTAFSLGLATHAAVEARRPVLLFSLEMSQLELSQRILCAEARVDSTKVRTGKLAQADWGKISHAVGRLAEAPIYIDDNANVTVMDIRAKARRLRSQLGDLGLIVIDYIQLMTGRSNAESRQVEVSEISRNLKILARELDTPVIALAQLNRALEQRADKRPMLSDLRESGSLEQDADVVLFLYRDEVYNPDSQDRGTAEVLVAKHRNGPVGKARLAWLEHYTKFANMARGV